MYACALPVCHKHVGKSMYADYCEALQLAVEYTREKNGDPEFSLGIDPYADVSTLSQKKATPNHSNKLCTPHNGSHVKRSSIYSSTVPKSRPKSAATASLSTSRRRRNGRVVDPIANSPIPADGPEHSHEGMKLESSKRAMDGEDTAGSTQEGPPHSILPDPSQEGPPRSIPPDSIQEGPSTCKEQGPPDSSPVSEAGHQPSSVCEGTLSNGLPSELSGVEGESTMPFEGDKGEEQRQRGAEREGTGGLPCSRMSGSEDGEDDAISVKAGEGSGGGLSDSDDDSMPTFSCKVMEDVKCKLKII